jgi:transposase
MARGPAVKIILGDSERSELEMRARRRKIARVDAVRAEIVLLAADGMNNCAIAATLGVSRLTVGLWRKRFAKKRFDGLDDEPRCGAPRKIGDEKIAEVVTKTLETYRSEGNTLRHPSGQERYQRRFAVRRVQLCGFAGRAEGSPLSRLGARHRRIH